MKIVYLLVVYLSGFVSALQLTKMIYGIPEHYDGNYWKLGIAIILPVISSALLIMENK